MTKMGYNIDENDICHKLLGGERLWGKGGCSGLPDLSTDALV